MLIVTILVVERRFNWRDERTVATGVAIEQTLNLARVDRLRVAQPVAYLLADRRGLLEDFRPAQRYRILE
ncbi:MAG TPA: hypothetical protein VL134_03385 [Leptolyngbya sp.]|nr:hypothetical protein [Leptolyngbya sp.]